MDESTSFISSTENVVEYLRYNSRSQIFAKSLPLPLVIGASKRLELLRDNPKIKEKLWEVAKALQSGLKEAGFNLGNTQSPVTPVFLAGGVGEGANLVLDLRENFNIFCSVVVYPVVPKDTIMLRVIPTAMHTLEDVKYTIEAFSSIAGKLNAGEYRGKEIVAGS